MADSKPPLFMRSFSLIPDPRTSEQLIRHRLFDMIFIAISACVSGVDDWQTIVLWAKTQEKWLRKYCRLENGIPSWWTFRRVFGILDPEALQGAFIDGDSVLAIYVESLDASESLFTILIPLDDNIIHDAELFELRRKRSMELLPNGGIEKHVFELLENLGGNEIRVAPAEFEYDAHVGYYFRVCYACIISAEMCIGAFLDGGMVLNGCSIRFLINNYSDTRQIGRIAISSWFYNLLKANTTE